MRWKNFSMTLNKRTQNGSKSLDEWFPRDAQGRPIATLGKRIGVVVGGSLTKGLQIKLDRDTSIEVLAVGR